MLDKLLFKCMLTFFFRLLGNILCQLVCLIVHSLYPDDFLSLNVRLINDNVLL